VAAARAANTIAAIVMLATWASISWLIFWPAGCDGLPTVERNSYDI